jgi:hypothetical protein
MKRPLVFAALLILALPAAVPSQREGKGPVPEYVGAMKCKVCHVATYRSWVMTKHARALEALRGGDRGKASCLRCHTTGFGRDGYGSPGVVIDLAGVQCEACHGPGSLYSKSSVMRDPRHSRQLGLVPVDSLTCTRCHNERSPTFKGFAFKAGLEKGTHLRQPAGRISSP